MRPVVGQLDVARAAMKHAARAWLLVVALVSMAHVGSPDTFFIGDAGPYRVRVSVRLPGVIPGRAQLTVRVVGAASPEAFRVAIRAGQWNVGLAGAPPAEIASPVPGDPELYAAEIWFMTATSYQVFVTVDGPSGQGAATVPVLALATAQKTMDRSLGGLLAALGIFLTLGMLTIVGCAVRESVVPPGVAPDAKRRRRARIAMGLAAIFLGLALWGGSRWWTAEASNYGTSVVYRPFDSQAAIAQAAGRYRLTLSIRDPRWDGKPVALSRYNALLPDHGKLMHLFMVREASLDALAHLHPVPRTPAALDFDVDVPPLPPGRYRVFGDIVHESGYAQTLVSSIDVPAPLQPVSVGDAPVVDPDDSWFEGAATPGAPAAVFRFDDGATLEWARGERQMVAGEERLLAFSARDASGAPLPVEPYMGMSAHVAIAHQDGSVFAHLHPSGSVSMAALQRFNEGSATAATAHAGHTMVADSAVSIPYAFPKAGSYHMWVQIKHAGRVRTAAFDVNVEPSR
jgi:hypothetical protein